MPLSGQRLEPDLASGFPVDEDCTLLEIPEDALNLFERAAKVFGDLSRQHVRIRQLGGVLQRLILQPEEVEAALVPRNDLLVGEHSPPAFRILLLVPRRLALAR